MSTVFSGKAAFLVSAVYALLALIVLLPCTSSAEAPTPNNSFFAFCMDTHDSEKRSLQEQAELLQELGYDGAGHLWLDDLDERITTLKEADLRLFQVYLRVNIADNAIPFDRRLQERVSLLKGTDAMLALLVTGLPPSDESGDARAVVLIREIAAIAASAGLRVVLYPHANDWLERVEDAIRIARKVDRPNVGIMFNLCHWLKVDKEENLTPVLEKALPYLMAVSIHGADTADEIQAGTGNWIQPLGSGSFDLYGLLQTLRDLQYQGPYGLQCYGIEGDAREHLARSIAAWNTLSGRLQDE